MDFIFKRREGGNVAVFVEYPEQEGGREHRFQVLTSVPNNPAFRDARFAHLPGKTEWNLPGEDRRFSFSKEDFKHGELALTEEEAIEKLFVRLYEYPQATYLGDYQTED